MRRPAVVLAAALALLPLAIATPVRAGTDRDLGSEFRGAPDGPLFLAIIARYHDRDDADTARLAARGADPDDLAVLLFLAGQATRPPDAILALRAAGRPWWAIGEKLGLPVGAWFVPLRHDPGPPFNRPYAAWRRLREAREPFPGLDDAQARDLVAVRLLSEYFGVPAEEAMTWRAGGKDVRTLAVAEYRRRHGAAAAAPTKDGGR